MPRRGHRPRPASSVPSPCTAVCRIDKESRLCVGCLRSMDEIRDWSIMTDEQKTEVLTLIDSRRHDAAA